eukprot:4081664-Prymnesium_polylepis.2
MRNKGGKQINLRSEPRSSISLRAHPSRNLEGAELIGYHLASRCRELHQTQVGCARDGEGEEDACPWTRLCRSHNSRKGKGPQVSRGNSERVYTKTQ